ncbi:hypothetical protein I4I83_12750 [Acidovorax cattleyae]|nr:hypothetical protein [Paracidovorax cattleyae]
MEKILGKGSLEYERTVPGTVGDEAEKVRYVSYDGAQVPSSLFRQVTRRITPPLMSGGGAVLEGCFITTPDSTHFYCLSYHGDIAGWQQQIEQGAKELGLITAKIEGQTLVLSDGRSFALSECQARFD